MNIAILLLGVGLSGPSPLAANPITADAITLRDGKVLLGQRVESEPRGPVLVVVRRAWAEANLPDRAATWAKAEAPSLRKAVSQRIERLRAWKAERRPDPAGGDRLAAWIDREMARLEQRDATADYPLMIARLTRGEVRSIDRKSPQDQRMLRLGWLSNLPDVESMPREELAQALEGRGFSAQGDSPASIDSLLPIPVEAEARWLVRRAATEVQNDPSGRLLAFQGLVIDEPALGEAPPAGAGLNALVGTLNNLLGEAPVDPLPGKLRELGSQGRVGAVVTRMELAADLAGAGVEMTLWVRGGERWMPAIVRSASANADDLPAGAGVGLADDPQVKAAFGVVESLGLGRVPDEVKQRSLKIGAATRKALAEAKAAFGRDLEAQALSLDPPKGREAGPEPKPEGRE